ncbi:GNAT family N-acetyltransferase [Undibacterium sp.]|uniref:GNAT family N-acetyltransferase n=1 Tax=Undibacterium sp. TaxID=1914977 RepID=UPI00374D22B4
MKTLNALPFIRPFEVSDWAAYRDTRLRSLADSPDAFGSTLASEQPRSDDDWAARLIAAAASGRDCQLMAEQGGRAVGLVWGKVDAEDDAVVSVFQMWVAPAARGQGIGSLLLRAVIAWARSRDARTVQLGVVCGDTPAARLYAREGFCVVEGSAEPLRAGSPLMSQSMRLMLNV